MSKKLATPRSLRAAHNKVGQDATAQVAKWPAWMREPPTVPAPVSDSAPRVVSKKSS